MQLQKGMKKGKSEAVIGQIREQIIRGLKPSDRLATFNEMEQAFGVSRAVLREAVNQLKREGFIYAVDRQGLYVADRPPHLSRFGLVFPNNPSAKEWPRFFTALHHEATGIQQERGDITFSSYHDVVVSPEAESYQRLVRDVYAQRLAGLILMPGAHHLGQSEPIAPVNIPKIYICGAVEVGRFPSISTDEIAMCDRMVDWLQKQKRQRIAVVGMWGNSQAQRAYLDSKKVPYQPHWVQTVGRDNAADIRRLVALLMDYPADKRPDGLIVLDDNLTEHVIGGLLECNLKIGQDIDVIAHCNWPWPIASSAPIQRVGFHARHVLSLALRAIELIRQGKTLSRQFVSVPALFESEINQPFSAHTFDPAQEITTR
jgi:DNA-binding LacI/PurR family transcriptional regulator